MTKTPSIGLEADINQIRKITSGFDKSACWDSNKIEALLSALAYSKIGRKSDEIDRPISFSFVHRRFHEYFCARYLKREYQSAPFEQFNSDNRWREILVLLCEVLPQIYLIKFSNYL
jgi:predicted NACHT family NTPase